MLLSSGLPENMWGNVVLSANYVLNRIPPKNQEQTPENYGNIKSLLINSYKYGGALQRFLYQNQKR